MLFLLTAAVATIATTTPTDVRVTVEAHTYRVTVRARAVTVRDKAFVTRRSPEQRDRMQKAVLQATGCAMADPYWEGTKLRGLLDCKTGG